LIRLNERDDNSPERWGWETGVFLKMSLVHIISLVVLQDKNFEFNPVHPCKSGLKLVITSSLVDS